MPIVMVCADCAAATPVAAASAIADSVMVSLVCMLVPVDPLLGVDPALEVTRLHAARLGAGPGIVGVLGPAELVVDDAEVDERLRRVAAEVLHHRELAL